MFDCHMHSTVSYDGHNTPAEMAAAAVAAGLREICFTDHLDYDAFQPREKTAFRAEDYTRAYENLRVPGLTVRFGAEVGLTDWNRQEVSRDLKLRHYDFVLGSIHYVDGLDIYLPPFWQGKTVPEAERRYLETMLECVRLHDDFDVLSHLTYISKARAHPARRRIPLADYREIVDEILKTAADKGKGLEINTSGVDRIGDFLPGEEYLRRFRELGGEIVTVGSDAHSADRVGQYVPRALAMVKEVFGYVCTFADRKPIFHKL